MVRSNTASACTSREARGITAAAAAPQIDEEAVSQSCFPFARRDWKRKQPPM
jgi:hypothetical protein